MIHQREFALSINFTVILLLWSASDTAAFSFNGCCCTVAADEIILRDIAHLRPWILMRLHYNSITFSLIKMGKVTQRAFIFGPVALGCRHIWVLRHTHTHMHTFIKSNQVLTER